MNCLLVDVGHEKMSREPRVRHARCKGTILCFYETRGRRVLGRCVARAPYEI